MKTQTTTGGKRTFYVSYTLYEQSDTHQYAGIRQLCEDRFKARYLHDTYFVCTTVLPASQIAKELYQAMLDETGQEGQVVVIDGTQGTSADAVRTSTAPGTLAPAGKASPPAS